MNKTLTINISGRVFYADEDAYKLLYDYLYNLKHAFSHQEGCDEIIDDLESRLAELLLERLSARQEVITHQTVEYIIAQLGSPEEIANEEANNPTEEKVVQPDEKKQTEGATPPPFEVRKQLFRDPDNRMLGGVLSGLAHYLGWDPTFLRLLMVLLMFFYGIVIPIYLVCWLIIPLASTAADKLSMHGRQVTIENIGKVVTDSFDSAGRRFDQAMDSAKTYMQSDKPRTALQRFADGLVRIIGILLTVALTVIAILLSPVLLLFLFIIIVLLLAFFAACIEGITGAYDVMFPYFENMAGYSHTPTIVCYISLFLGLALILLCTISSIFHWAFKWKNFSPRTLKVLSIISLICLIVAAVTALTAGGNITPLPYLFE